MKPNGWHTQHAGGEARKLMTASSTLDGARAVCRLAKGKKATIYSNADKFAYTQSGPAPCSR